MGSKKLARFRQRIKKTRKRITQNTRFSKVVSKVLESDESDLSKDVESFLHRHWARKYKQLSSDFLKILDLQGLTIEDKLARLIDTSLSTGMPFTQKKLHRSTSLQKFAWSGKFHDCDCKRRHSDLTFRRFPCNNRSSMVSPQPIDCAWSRDC